MTYSSTDNGKLFSAQLLTTNFHFDQLASSVIPGLAVLIFVCRQTPTIDMMNINYTAPQAYRSGWQNGVASAQSIVDIMLAEHDV